MLYSLKSSEDLTYSILFKYKSTKLIHVAIGFRMSHYVEARLPVLEMKESPNNSVLRTPLYGIIASLAAVIVSVRHYCDSYFVR